jgi:histidine triad (HIT) family protein
MALDTCVFCSIRDNALPSKKIAETDDIFVIEDLHPKASVHYLIIPKVHKESLLACSQDEQHLLGNMLLMAKQLGQELPDPQAFRLLVNNGYAAGQRVFHLHIHFLSGNLTNF